jgi:hypothetical protein
MRQLAVHIRPACLVIFALVSLSSANEKLKEMWSEYEPEVHGFVEGRAGYRLQDDAYQKDMSIMETRTQVDLTSLPEWGEIVIKGDAYLDGVTERGEFDLREANAAFTPTDFMDLKLGRQILTWGKGDLIFINDMFPKDWQSFFIGRDTEYLKAPSDALKAGFFSETVNLDVVYTPRFDPDRYIKGERLSYWNGVMGQTAGQNAIIHSDKPNRWFRDEEVAARVYRNVQGVDLALYGYWGYWKSPGGMNAAGTQAQFPSLDVYGASLQGPLGKGILSTEVGYYDSKDDSRGTNALINNSEMRYLLGYSREIGRDFTAGLQYYVEQLLNYSEYRAALAGGPARDRYRHLLTLRFTKLLMNQNLRCSVFGYYSPSDDDVYFRPNINYKANDNTSVEVGANIFAGDDPHTFFGQFEDNTNLYGAIRYSF